LVPEIVTLQATRPDTRGNQGVVEGLLPQQGHDLGHVPGGDFMNQFRPQKTLVQFGFLWHFKRHQMGVEFDP
jgi:hypothetical protein